MEAEATALATPLAGVHRENGAKVGVWFGCNLPDSFACWQNEYRALRENVGLIDKNYRAYVTFTGPDRTRYLNAILTNDIKGLAENHGNLSLFLNPQGHIQAEIETHALGDKLFCVTHAMIRERLIPALDKYIIMDDVTQTDRTGEVAALALEGPRAAAAIAELTGLDLNTFGELESREVKVKGVDCRVVRRTPGEHPSGEFLLRSGQVRELWDVLSDAMKSWGGQPAGYEALNSLRLEQGVPWFGYDFGEKQIPHEAGLQDSHISYTKGCYTGQEIVERVRSRGQINRVRVSLQFEGTRAPAAGTPLKSEGKELGYVTRIGFSPLLQAQIGMGYVRREKSGAGNLLESVEGSARVIAAPLVRQS